MLKMNPPEIAFFQKNWWTKQRILTIGLISIFVIVMSIIRGAYQRVGFDFPVFWEAGRCFIHGENLYTVQPGARPFWYPPFAAMAFIVFALFPLKISGGIFYAMNIVLIFVCVHLTKLIFEHFYPQRSSFKWPLILAVVFSARFFINNINLLESNEIWLTLCLFGIYAFLKDKLFWACVCFVIGTYMKIIPVFFLFWVIIRGKFKAAVYVGLAGIICFAVPVLLRGPRLGVQDHIDYYNTFLGDFKKGKVITQYTNQNLSSAIHRLFLPSDNEENLDYQLFSLPKTTVETIYKIVAGLIFMGFLINLIILRMKNAPVTPFEVCTPFLMATLLSGITWKAHLVSMLFVFMAVFTVDYTKLKKVEKMIYAVVCFLIGFTGMTGREILGSELHYYFGGYSAITWVLLILFCWYIIYSQRGPRLISEAK